jgi:anti-sigma factor RsiW
MKNNLSPRDWELLSSYMDGQLSDGKRVQLEARLEVSPDLRAALDELTRTRAMLRSLPRMKAPRSFKLTPEMVGQREPRRLYPFFQLASALTSVMLVLVLLTDFLGFSFQAPLGRMTSQAPEPTIEAELLLERAPPGMSAEDLPEARKALPEEFPAPAALAEEAQVEGLMAPETAIVEEPAEEHPAEPAEVPAGEPEPELFLAVPAPPEPTPELEAGGVEAFAEPVIPAAPPAVLPEAAFQGPEPQADSFIVESDRVTESALTSMRVLQISLAILAAATALVALYLRRIGV